MTSDGGGWTRVMRMNGKAATFVYDAPYWTNTVGLNVTVPGFEDSEAKLESFWTVGYTELRLGMKLAGTTNWVVMSHVATSLRAALLDGVFKPTVAIGRGAWKNLIAGSTMQVNCNREGLNNWTQEGWAKVRIGILGNEQADCSSPDSRIGFGGAGNVCGIDPTMPAGSAAGCGGDTGEKSVKADWGFIFVR
jgi:hypothetical protein